MNCFFLLYLGWFITVFRGSAKVRKNEHFSELSQVTNWTVADRQFERRLAAIVAADVVGYSRLMGLDETGTLSRLKALRQTLIEPMINRYNGRIVKLMGDGVLIEFPSVVDALACAVQIQREMPSHNDTVAEDQHIAFRIGINLGDILVEEDDLYGDGVNIAARLEPLAEPDGICLSQAARDALGSKLTLDYEDMGEQILKNITEPVRAWRVKVPANAVMPKGSSTARESKSNDKSRSWHWMAAAVVVVLLGAGSAWLWWPSDTERAALSRMAYALPDRPSIAVLPFDNMSNDPEQEYFSDGISEDIITDLSKISGLFVVARNSSFTYKGTPVKIRQVAEDLGVRYVLEGSVRRSGDHIRINTQLIDALEGDHLWAERYDRELKDIFALQSEIAQRVVDALSVTLKAGEHERLFLKHTAKIDAYDVFLQARRTVDSPSRENIERGEELFKHVIELDPNFAGGYAGLSFNHSVKVRFRYSEKPKLELQRSLELARKAIELDRNFAWGHIALAGAHLSNGDPDAAVKEAEQALALQPNGYKKTCSWDSICSLPDSRLKRWIT